VCFGFGVGVGVGVGVRVRVRVRDGVRVRVKGSGCEGSARRTLLTITYAAPCEGCSNDALNSPPCLRTTWIRVSLGLGC